jgi:hypothetical protein
MADNPPAIQLIDSEPDGYCDPESGVCVLPGAPAATGSGTRPAEDTATVGGRGASARDPYRSHTCAPDRVRHPGDR